MSILIFSSLMKGRGKDKRKFVKKKEDEEDEQIENSYEQTRLLDNDENENKLKYLLPIKTKDGLVERVTHVLNNNDGDDDDDRQDTVNVSNEEKGKFKSW